MYHSYTSFCHVSENQEICCQVHYLFKYLNHAESPSMIRESDSRLRSDVNSDHGNLTTDSHTIQLIHESELWLSKQLRQSQPAFAEMSMLPVLHNRTTILKRHSRTWYWEGNCARCPSEVGDYGVLLVKILASTYHFISWLVIRGLDLGSPRRSKTPISAEDFNARHLQRIPWIQVNP